MRFRFLAALVVLALAGAACGDDTAATTTATTSEVTVDVGGGLSDTIDELVAATEQIRGLEFIEPPRVTILSPEELSERVRAEIDEQLDPTELAVQQAWFELLGLLDPTIELGEALKDLYAEQVGGFYDPETTEMFVADRGELTPLAKTIVVHELVHALTDQHYQFDDKMSALDDEERFHEAAALQALAEGDAMHVQLQYMQTLPSDQQIEAITESLGVDTTVMDSLPEWFGEDLTFPYDSGFAFVSRLLDERGLEGLNQTYEMPPSTTKQILHPEAYFRMEPARPVSLPDTPLDGYEVFEEGELGEWNLRLYLLEGRDPGEALVAAAGWGGDVYRMLWDGEQVAFVYLFEGDTARDAEELAESLAEAIPDRMAVTGGRTSDGETTFVPAGAFAYLRLDGNRVLVITADDPVAGQSLVDQLPRPSDS